MSRINGSFIRSHWAIIILLFLAAAIRLAGMTDSIWQDEVYSSRLKLQDIPHLLEIARISTHPPVHYITMFLWNGIFGDSEISMRAPAYIFGIASILLVYLFALKYFDKRTAVFTAFLMTLSPVHIRYCNEARPYSAILFFFMVFVFSFNKLEESNRRIMWYIIYGLSAFLCAFMHYYLIPYIVIVSLMCLFSANGADRKVLTINTAILSIFFCFIVIKTGFFTFTASYENVPLGFGHLRPFTFFEFYMLFFNWFTFSNSIWMIFPYHASFAQILKHALMVPVQAVYLVIFLYGIYATVMDARKPYGTRAIIYMFTLPVVLLVLSAIGPKMIYIERSAYMVFPFFLMILSKGALGIKNRSVSRPVLAAMIVLSLLALARFFALQGEWTVYQPKADYRSVYRYLLHQKEGRVVVFALVPSDPLLYYDLRYREGHEKENGCVPPDIRIEFVDAEMYYGARYRQKFRNPRVEYVAGMSPSKAIEIAAANNVKSFYLIHNRYLWRLNNFKKIYSDILRDPRLREDESRPFRSIKVYKFHITP